MLNKRFSWRKKSALTAFIAGAFAWQAPQATATDLYWVNGTSDWHSAANWTTDSTGTTIVGSAVPTASDVLTFNGSTINGDETVTLSAVGAALGLIFNNTGTTTLQSDSVTTRNLTLGANGITVNSGAGLVTIGNATNGTTVTLGASQTWNNNGTLTLVNGLAMGANPLIISGTGVTNIGTLSGTVASGTTALTINAGSTVNFTNTTNGASGGNTFTGNILINGGTLSASMTGAGATSALGGQIGTAYRQVILQGGGTFISNSTWNDNVPSATVVGIVFNFAGNGTLNVASGTSLTLDDGTGTGTASTNTQLQGSGILTKSGLGVLSLGNAAVSNAVFTGQILVNQGVLKLGSLSAAGVGLGATSANTVIASGAAFDVNNSAATAAEPLTISGTGAGALALYNAGTGNGTNAIYSSSTAAGSFAGPITLAADSTIGAGNSGTMTLSGGVTGAFGLTIKNLNGGGTTLSGAVNNAGTITNNGGGAGLTTISSVVGTNVTGVIQDSATSQLTLSNAANTFTSAVTISQGTLNASSVTGFGAIAATTNLTLGTATTQGTLNYTGGASSSTRPIVIGGAGGGVINSTTGLLTLTGTVSLASGPLTIGGANSVTIGSATATNRVSGTNALTKTGAGTLTLSTLGGNAAISGAMPINIQQGTLAVNTTAVVTANVLGTGTITLTPGATLTYALGNIADTITNPLTVANASGTATIQISSGGVVDSGAITFAAGANTPTLRLLNTNGTAQANGFSGGVTGTGNLQLSSNGTGGTITLSGASSVNNVGTIVSNGTSTGTVTISAPIGSNVTSISQAGTNAFVISGQVALNATNNTFTSTNTGLWTFSNANVFSGTQPVTFNANSTGGITVSGTNLNHTGDVTNSGTNSGVTTISSAIGANVGSIIQNSATSPLVLSGTNLYTGNATISNGLMQFAKPAAIPNYPTTPANVEISVASGGILGFTYGSATQFAEADVTALVNGAGSTYANVSFAATGAAIGLDTSTANASFTSVLADPTGPSAALGLVKLGANTLTLSGANTYTGPTSVRNGTLSVDTFNSVNGGTPLLPNSSLGAPTTIADGTISIGYTTTAAGLTYTGAGETSDRLINLSGTTGGATITTAGTGTLSLGGVTVAAGAKTLTLATTSDLAFSGPIAGTISTGASALTIVKSGAGTVTLPAAGSTATTLTISGGTFNTGAGGLTLGNAGAGTINTTGATAGSTVYVNGKIILAGVGAAANGADVGAIANVTLDLSGAVIDGGPSNNMDFNPAGTVILGNANTYQGQTQFVGTTANATSFGTASGATPSSFGQPSGTSAAGSPNSTILLQTGTLRYVGTGETTDRAFDLRATTTVTVLEQAGTGNLKFTAANTATGAGSKVWTLQGSTAGTGEIAGAIVDNSTANTTGIAKAGTGTWTLSGPNTYTGPTTVNGGKLVLTTGSTANSLVTVNSSGTLAVTGNYTIGNAATAAKGGSLVLAAGGMLDLADGAISTLTLTQNATFATAGAAYNGGTIKLDVSGAAADSIVNGGGTIGSTSSGLNAIVINPISGFGLGSYPIIVGGAGTGSISNSNFYLASSTINYLGTPYSLSLSQVGKDEILTIGAFVAADPAAAYWAGTTDAKWNTQAGGIGSGGATNWFAGPTGPDTFSLPGANTNVTFTANTATNLSTTLEQNFAINSLAFSGTATSNTAGSTIAAGGSFKLTLNANAVNGNTAGNGITVAAGSGANTISADVVLGQSQTWTNNSTNTLTVSGVIDDVGGGYALTKAGTGLVVLSGNNTYGGATAINAGTLQIGSGGTTGTLGGGAVTVATTSFLAINRSNAISIGNNITGAGGLQQIGTGTTTLTGTNGYTGQTIVDGGTLYLNGNTTTTTGQYLIANSASSEAILQIGTGTSLTSTIGAASAMRIGVGAGSVGVVTQNGGTVTLGTVANNYNLALGGDGGTSNSANTNYNFGAYNLNGGTVTAFQTEVGDSGGTGMVTITDGTMGSATGARHFIIGRFGNSTGVVTLVGTGSATPTLLGASSTLGIGMGWQDVSNNNRQELNIGDKALVNAASYGVGGGLVWRAGAGTTGNIGIANLLTGGTLQTGYIGNVSGTGPITSILNLNGGKIIATQNSTTFSTLLTSAYVYPAGGTIDTAAFNDTFAPLLAPTGNGVNSVSASGTGYITAPYVKITGDGVGATGYATIDGSGNITGVVVTNPGVGYTTAPTVTLVGGGGTGSGTATIAANSSSGGITKEGSGILTLSGVNTFGGPVVINNGTVAFGNTTAQSIPGAISGVGSLSQTGSGTTTIGNSTNSYSGITTISGGTLSVASLEDGLTNSSIGASSNDAANLVFGTGSLLYTGGTKTIDRNFTLTAGTIGTINISQASTTLTLPGATGTVTTGALTKAGPGTLTLTGAQTYTGNTTVSGGTLNIPATASLTGNGVAGSGSILAFGGTAANTVVNIAGNINTYFAFSGAAVNGANAVYNQTAGTVNFTNTGTGAANNSLQNGANTGYGYMNITGGTTVIKGRFQPAGGGTGVIYIGGTGKIDNTAGEWLLMSYGSTGSTSSITVGPGGILDRVGATASFGLNMDVINSYAVLNVAGGEVKNTNRAITFGNGTATGKTGTSGYLNLASGTLSLGTAMLNGNTGAGSTGASFINFAGGTLQTNAGVTAIIPASVATQSITTTIFGAINNSAATGDTSQNFTGGLTFDSLTFNSSLTNVLNGASGTGVTQADIDIVDGGTGYIGAPMVKFSTAGVVAGGTPAAGYAIISGGSVTGIVITDPGTYTSGTVPTITLIGGGATSAANVTVPGSAATGLITANANTGGLTKLGTGTLTLSGANTFGGVVDIRGGMVTTTTLANGGATSGIGNSSNAASNVLLNSATTGGILGYNGTVAGTTDRNFTLANVSGGFDASGTTLGTFTLTAANTLTVAPSLGAATLTLQGTGTGATGAGSIGTLLADGSGTVVGLSKTGTGTWNITNAANSYTGPTAIGGGTLSVSTLASGGVNSNIGSSTNAATNLNFTASGTLQYTGATQVTDRDFTIANGATATFDITSATSTLTLGGVPVASTGALTKTSAGALILNGATNYSGITTLSAGSLTFGGAFGAGALNVAPTTVLTMLNDGAGNNGTIAQGNAFNITASAAGSANAIVLNVGNDGGGNTGNTIALGALNNQVATTSQMFLTVNGSNGYGVSFTSYAMSNLNGNNNTITANAPVIINGNVTNGVSVAAAHYDTFFMDGTSAGSQVNGVISDSSVVTSVGNGDTRLTKNGTGTWTLTGTNTFTGPVVVNAGTLKVSGATAGFVGNATGAPTITLNPVASGASPTFAATPGTATMTLGNATVATLGTVLTVKEGTTANPIATTFTMQDNAVGTVNLVQGASVTNGLVVGAASTAGYVRPSLNFDIGGASLTDIDLLAVTRNASVGTGGATLNFAALTSSTSLTPGDYTFMTALGGLNQNLTLGTTLLNVGGNTYSLSLANSTATAEKLTVSLVSGFYWTGSQGDGKWNTLNAGPLANFSTDDAGTLNTTAIPSSTSNVIFTADSATNLSTTLEQSFSINSLNFTGTGTSNTAGTTIASGTGGPYTLTLGATAAGGNVLGSGLTVQPGSGPNLISANVALGSAQTWSAAPSTQVTVSGDVNAATFALNVTGGGTVALTGNVSGTGSSITLASTSGTTLTLAGTNSTYTGGTVLNPSTTLNINGVKALGTGTLTINGGTLNNTSAGTVVNTNVNAQTWTNNASVIFTGTQALNLGTGAVTFGADATAASFTITNNSALTGTSLTVGGAITPGTGGTAAGKTLNIAGPGSTALTGSITKGTATSMVINVTSPGTTTLSGAASSITTLNVNGGAGSIIDIGAGNITLVNAGANGIQSTTGGTINGTGTIVLGSNATSPNYLDNGTASGTTLTINAKIVSSAAGNGFEVYNGGSSTGVVYLTNPANTYNTGTNIDGGILRVDTVGNQSVNSPTGNNTTIFINGAAGSNVLRYTGTGETTNKIISLSGTTNGGTLEQAGTGLLKFTNFATPGAGSKTLILTGSTAGTGEISAAIVNNTTANTTGILKSGSGTWTLSGANTYTGATTINEGSLIYGANYTVGTALNFGSANAITTTGTADFTNFNGTFTSLLVRTNSATPNQINVGASKTLTINGNMTLGYDAAGGTGATLSNLTVSGAGSMAINGTTIALGVNQAATNAGYFSSGTLDVTGLGSFSTNVTNFNIGVSSTTGSVGNLLLSNTANTLIATTLSVGDSGTNNGNGTSTLTLGIGSNVLRADTINIGRGKNTAPGVVKFVSQTTGSPGTVTIANKAGTGAAAIDIGNINGVGTGGGAVGTLDLRGHVATVNASTLTLGSNNGTSTGGTNGTLHFDAGTFDVVTLNVAPKSAAGVAAATGTLNIGGGTFSVSTAFTLGSQVTAGTSVATLNLTGGTFNSSASILDGGGATTSTITLDGGTLNLNNNNIGSATVSIDNVNLRSGTLNNVAQINNGAAVSKTTTGTLTYTGTNAYTGTTTVSQGKLNVNGSLTASPVIVASTGTLVGTGTLGGSVTVQSGGFISPGNSPGTQTYGAGLTLDAGSTFNWEHNAGNAVGTASTNWDVANITGGTLTVNNTPSTGSKLALYFDATTDFANSTWDSNLS